MDLAIISDDLKVIFGGVVRKKSADGTGSYNLGVKRVEKFD